MFTLVAHSACSTPLFIYNHISKSVIKWNYYFNQYPSVNCCLIWIMLNKIRVSTASLETNFEQCQTKLGKPVHMTSVFHY